MITTQLGSLGVPMSLVEHALMVLLVLFEVFESEVPAMHSIKPKAVQAAFDRNAEAVRFFEGIPESEASEIQQVYVKNMKEHTLLAFLTSYLQYNTISWGSPAKLNWCAAAVG